MSSFFAERSAVPLPDHIIFKGMPESKKGLLRKASS
jgi:hypothetical protein